MATYIGVHVIRLAIIVLIILQVDLASLLVNVVGLFAAVQVISDIRLAVIVVLEKQCCQYNLGRGDPIIRRHTSGSTLSKIPSLSS